MPKTTFWRTLFLSVGLWLVMCSLAVPAQAATHQISAATVSHIVKQAQPPTAQSVLIVLLDRSGSLASTDPDEYSTSIAKILADLWPGKMVVIFFSGDNGPLPQTALVDLTQSGARDALKSQIEKQRNAVNGDTPTQIAVEQAENVLAQQNYPTGSRVVIITDGQPDTISDPNGQAQIQAIENDAQNVFASHNVPISTFGLGNEVPDYAKTFLQKVANETGGEFNDVTDSSQLALPVIKMYANWQNLKFVPASGKNTFFIDTYAAKVDFITFEQNRDAHPVTLLDPNQQQVPISAFQDSSQDKHYDFESLVTTQFNQSGNYTIQTDDPDAQAYALEQTRLQVEIVTPTPQTPVYTGQPLTVSAALYDHNNPQQHVLLKTSDTIVIGLSYTLSVHGQTVDSAETTLTQDAPPNADLFSATITPKQTGTLTITIIATYQTTQKLNQPSITLPVTVAPPPPPPPCALTDVRCLIQRYGVEVGITLPIIVLALIALWWFTRQAPFGLLVNPDGVQRILGRNRTLGRSLLHKSTLFSDELRGFAWGGANFTLRFKRGGQAYFVARNKTPDQEIGCVVKQENQPATVGKEIFLHNGDQIVINGQTQATFYTSRTRVQQADQAWL